MGLMTNLDGVKEKNLETDLSVQFFRSVSGALKILQSYRNAISSSDHGSISVWKDDDGKYRAGFYIYQITQDKFIGNTKKELKAWLVKWFPKLQGT